MKIHYFTAALAVLAIALAGWQFFRPQQRNGFLYNEKVFAAFKGTELLKTKLEQRKAADQQVLDSLRRLISIGRDDVRATYSAKYSELASTEEQLTNRFTADIWKQINNGVAAFGKEKNYTYIFGAAGDGSLMYADHATDITDEVIKFLNERYEREGAQ